MSKHGWLLLAWDLWVLLPAVLFLYVGFVAWLSAVSSKAARGAL